MKNLSLNKVNQLRSGQTLFWVEARVEESNMTFVVDIHEQLLKGKKFMLPASGLFFFEKGPAAVFVTKKNPTNAVYMFVVPTDLLVERWFFANRRSAQQAAAELRDGKHPQVLAVLLEDARERLEKRQEEERVAANKAAWESANPGKDKPPIRAWGESESFLDLSISRMRYMDSRRQVQGRPFPQVRRPYRPRRISFPPLLPPVDDQHRAMVREIAGSATGSQTSGVAAGYYKGLGVVKKLLASDWSGQWERKDPPQ